MENFNLEIKGGSSAEEGIRFMFKTSYIPSVNSMYDINWANRTKYRSKEVIELTRQIELQLDEYWDESFIPWFRPENNIYYSFSIQPLFKSNWSSRDLDNTNKVVQDVIFSYFGVNDNRIIENHMYKSRRMNSSNEYLICEIKESNFDPFFYESLL